MPKPSTKSGKLSSSGADRAFRKLLQVLPPEWKLLMVELKAFVYGNKIRSSEELLRVILLYCGQDLSLMELSLVMRLDNVVISGPGLSKRVNRCADFLEWLVKEAMGWEDLPLLPGGRRFLACDGTELSRPGPHLPRLRLHLCIDLVNLSFVQAQLTSSKQGETLKQFKFQSKDVVLGDRNFCRYKSLMYVKLDCGADVLARWHPSFHVYESSIMEKSLDLSEKLKDLETGSIITVPVCAKYSKLSHEKNKRELNGHLHIYRMTEEEAKRSQRTLFKNYKRKNRSLDPKTRFLSHFVILFTTLSPLELSAEAALALYRCRWQIELAIKSLKSLLNIEKLRANPHSRLAQVYIWGKFLYMLLIDHRVRTCFEQDWTNLGSIQRRCTPWRPTKLIKRQIDSILLRSHRWKPEKIAECAEVFAQKPRKNRPLQTLPAEVLRLAKLPPPSKPQFPASPQCSTASRTLRALPPPTRSTRPAQFVLLPSPVPQQLLLEFG